MDIRQTENYANYMRSLGWIVEKAGGANVFIKKILFFSIIKVQRPEGLDRKRLEEIKKKYRAIKVNIEPGSGWHLLPTKTIILDLKNIRLPKDTRYEIRKALANNLKVEPSADIDKFYWLLEETMKIGGWWIPIKKEVNNLYRSFQPDNSVVLLGRAGRTGNFLSGCLLIWGKDTAHYMYAANTAAGRKRSAAYLTLWEAIKFCQKKKLKYLDLEGIYDERYPDENRSWRGFTKFKTGWGGKVVEY